ncbi:hypothetical protein F8A10_04030 [Paracoccus kondratievae]|nr:hypothetical protein F8A10_04030 [Paracoccus kondratievae]
MGIILMVVSAVITGTFWYNREKADPSSARKWKLALLLTIATVAIQLGIVALLVSALEQVQQLTREFNGGDRPIIIGAVVGIILLEFLLLRAGIWWGVRNGIKSQARIIGKA